MTEHSARRAAEEGASHGSGMTPHHDHSRGVPLSRCEHLFGDFAKGDLAGHRRRWNACTDELLDPAFSFGREKTVDFMLRDGRAALRHGRHGKYVGKHLRPDDVNSGDPRVETLMKAPGPLHDVRTHRR